MPEPTKIELLILRKHLVEQPADQPLPPELRRALDWAINWAIWRIDLPLTRDQIRYQRAYLVDRFVNQYIARRPTERGAREWAYAQAANMLTGPYAGSPRAMRESFCMRCALPATIRVACGTEKRLSSAPARLTRSERSGGPASDDCRDNHRAGRFGHSGRYLSNIGTTAQTSVD